LIFIGVGANLRSPQYGPPRTTCGAALDALAREGLTIVRRSHWYRSAPWPASMQPWYVNGVVQVDTELPPGALLDLLLTTETRFGRRRGLRNAARILDLDLLAFNDLVTDPAARPAVPHPRMHERAFVLLPLAEIAADWRHPGSGKAIADLIAALPPDQVAHPMPDGPGKYGTEWKPSVGPRGGASLP